jgi:hypothetical protein
MAVGYFRYNGCSYSAECIADYTGRTIGQFHWSETEHVSIKLSLFNTFHAMHEVSRLEALVLLSLDLFDVYYQEKEVPPSVKPETKLCVAKITPHREMQHTDDRA